MNPQQIIYDQSYIIFASRWISSNVAKFYWCHLPTTIIFLLLWFIIFL